MTSDEMYALNNWKCGNCQRNVLQDVKEYVYGVYDGMPSYIEFYCPNCKAILEIELGWQLPIINYMNIIYTHTEKGTKC